MVRSRHVHDSFPRERWACGLCIHKTNKTRSRENLLRNSRARHGWGASAERRGGRCLSRHVPRSTLHAHDPLISTRKPRYHRSTLGYGYEMLVLSLCPSRCRVDLAHTSGGSRLESDDQTAHHSRWPVPTQAVWYLRVIMASLGLNLTSSVTTTAQLASGARYGRVPAKHKSLPSNLTPTMRSGTAMCDGANA